MRLHVPPRLRGILAIVIAGALVLALTACADDDNGIMQPGDEATPQPGDTTVTVVDFAFEPGSINIDQGDTVTFQHEGNETHTVTINGINESGDLEAGDTFAFAFDRVGEHHIHCDYHPDMTLDVTVTGPVD